MARIRGDSRVVTFDKDMAIFNASDALDVDALTAIDQDDVADGEVGAVSDENALTWAKRGNHAEAFNYGESPRHASIVPDQPVLMLASANGGNLEVAVNRIQIFGGNNEVLCTDSYRQRTLRPSMWHLRSSSGSHRSIVSQGLHGKVRSIR